MLEFLRAIVLQALRDTWAWISHHLAERANFALAALLGTMAATFLFRGVTREAIAVGIVSGLLSLVALLFLQLVRNLAAAPAKVRAKKTNYPGKSATVIIRINPGTKPLDQLQHDALYMIRKLEHYRGFRKILGHGEINDRHADQALSELVREIESFGRRARTLGQEVVSRRSCREALALYQDIRSPTHSTDLDATVARIYRFTRPRLRWHESIRRALRRKNGAH